MLVLAAIIGYFLGAIPFGVIVSRSQGVNILDEGSGNPGFTNVLRQLGPKAAIVVLVFDMLKGYVAAAIGDYLGGDLGMLIGFAGALIGHSLSCFIHFKGGKGIATGAGGLLYINPLTFVLCALTVIVPAYLTKYMSLGAILSAALCPLYLHFTGSSPVIVGGFAVLCIYVIFLHRSNIKRLMEGRENKISLGKKAK